MNIREEMKLRNWVRLRGKTSISFVDVLAAQRKAFHVTWAIFLGIGLYSLSEFGVHSLPSGVFLGGIATFVGYLLRTKWNMAIELRYVDWKKVEEALDEIRR